MVSPGRDQGTHYRTCSRVRKVYTSAAFYLVGNGPELSAATALTILLLGLTIIWINFDTDHSRYVFRRTNGECLLFGSPPDKTAASYTPSDGTRKENLLLVDGWWKISRPFHCVPETLASLCWLLPALDSGVLAPYSYVVYLTIL